MTNSSVFHVVLQRVLASIVFDFSQHQCTEVQECKCKVLGCPKIIWWKKERNSMVLVPHQITKYRWSLHLSNFASFECWLEGAACLEGGGKWSSCVTFLHYYVERSFVTLCIVWLRDWILISASHHHQHRKNNAGFN